MSRDMTLFVTVEKWTLNLLRLWIVINWTLFLLSNLFDVRNVYTVPIVQFASDSPGLSYSASHFAWQKQTTKSPNWPVTLIESHKVLTQTRITSKVNDFTWENREILQYLSGNTWGKEVLTFWKQWAINLSTKKQKYSQPTLIW